MTEQETEQEIEATLGIPFDRIMKQAGDRQMMRHLLRIAISTGEANGRRKASIAHNESLRTIAGVRRE